MDKWDANLLNSLMPTIGQAEFDVEQAFQVLTGEALAIDGLKDAIGSPGLEHIDKLLAFWKTKLRGELLPFAYGSLPD